MALSATIHRFLVTLSDVDRGVYETLAYCLSYEEGIAFSKGGLSSAEEPPIAIHDPTGVLLAWIDVGSPSAERLHKAAKAARRVAVYTHVEPALLRREAAR